MLWIKVSAKLLHLNVYNNIEVTHIILKILCFIMVLYATKNLISNEWYQYNGNILSWIKNGKVDTMKGFYFMLQNDTVSIYASWPHMPIWIIQFLTYLYSGHCVDVVESEYKAHIKLLTSMMENHQNSPWDTTWSSSWSHCCSFFQELKKPKGFNITYI